MEITLIGTDFGGVSVSKGIKFILQGVVLLQACNVFRVTLWDGWAFVFCVLTTGRQDLPLQRPQQGAFDSRMIERRSLMAVGAGACLA